MNERALAIVVLVAAALVNAHGDDVVAEREHVDAAATMDSGREVETLPGAEPHSRDLLASFAAMRKRRGDAYKPRTKHLAADGSARYTNRLFLETSPYLLQHAHNPVGWYPWGDEAFETARRLRRPVLLSIGYSTCHWCHIMEEESFEDEDVARMLNERYVAVKVDREERPDIDAVYMAVVQALTGGGGWPMTVWLTPDRQPFFGGTYFPARDGDRGTQTGFLTLLLRLKEIYDTEPDRVLEQGRQLTAHLSSRLGETGIGNALPTTEILHAAFSFYASRFDADHGGLVGAPKFPSSLPVRWLLRYHRRTGNADALAMATLTLRKMMAGGIYDHVGGGFHRYSTDRAWTVPHFEKMLYDNALLVMAYLEAYQVSRDDDFLGVVHEILRYVERDMTAPEGAFYSATDADSLTPGGHREEGYCFTWTPDELNAALGEETAAVVKTYYGVTHAGNFEGRNILHTPVAADTVASGLGISPEALGSTIADAKETLYRVRNLRPPPIRDDKILTAWNGLMISAHARAGLVTGEQSYIERGVRAAAFVRRNLYAGGRLFRSYKDGVRRHNAYLDDYAFYIAALLDLYEATHDIDWLEFAIELERTLATRYEDRSGGGFFMTSNDHETLLVREKPGYDGAEPSGNSVAALNLLRLHEFTTDVAYRRRAEGVFKAFHETLANRPAALAEMLLAVDFLLDKPKELVVVTPARKTGDADRFLYEIHRAFLPNRVLIVLDEGADFEIHGATIPLVKGKRAMRGHTTAYVCERGICRQPTQDPQEFAELIRAVKTLE